MCARAELAQEAGACHNSWWISYCILRAQCLETFPNTSLCAERRHLRHGEVGSQAFGSTAACSVLPSTLHVFLCQPAGGWSRPGRRHTGTSLGLAMRWQCEPKRESGCRTSISSLVEFPAEHAAWHASECTAYTSCPSSTMRPQPRWLPVQGVASGLALLAQGTALECGSLAKSSSGLPPRCNGRTDGFGMGLNPTQCSTLWPASMPPQPPLTRPPHCCPAGHCVQGHSRCSASGGSRSCGPAPAEPRTSGACDCRVVLHPQHQCRPRGRHLCDRRKRPRARARRVQASPCAVFPTPRAG